MCAWQKISLCKLSKKYFIAVYIGRNGLFEISLHIIGDKYHLPNKTHCNTTYTHPETLYKYVTKFLDKFYFSQSSQRVRHVAVKGAI